MLTVLHVTARGAHCLVGSDLGQYDLLAASLAAQVDAAGAPFTAYELVVVDKVNPLPRPELARVRCDGGVRQVRPRATPWTRAGAFAPNAARNTGLALARGDVVCGLDDGYELAPGYLARCAGLAAGGRYAAAMLRQRDASVAYPPQPQGPVGAGEAVGGVCCYPLAAAVAVNGWDERFDGCSGGDIDFTARLRAAGVAFVRDPAVAVTGWDHGARAWAHPRCWRLALHLAERRRADGDLRANAPWTAAELAAWAACARRTDDCPLTGFPCDHIGMSLAHEIMVGYESGEWFDLAAARAAVADEER